MNASLAHRSSRVVWLSRSGQKQPPRAHQSPAGAEVSTADEWLSTKWSADGWPVAGGAVGRRVRSGVLKCTHHSCGGDAIAKLTSARAAGLVEDTCSNVRSRTV